MARARDAASDVGPALAEELLSSGRELVLRARGSSMCPLLRDGDVLTLAGCTRPPRPGDLVAAISNGRLLLHRVVRVRPGACALQGDALWQPDGWFACQYLGHHTIARDPPEPRIIGRGIAIVRGDQPLGRWRLGGPIARAWLFVLPLIRISRGVARRARAGLVPG